VDHFGGRADLKAGLIRVLHTFSFVDDPTRILRALRFSARFGFELETQTAELLKRALAEGRLDDVSPERIREEILLCLNEDEPWQALSRVCEAGIFGVLHHGIHPPACLSDVDDPVREALQWLREFIEPADSPAKDLSYLAFLLCGSNPVEAMDFVMQHHFDSSVIEVADALSLIPAAWEALRANDLKPSELALQLDRLPPPIWTVLAAEAGPGSKERAVLRRYIEKLRHVRPVLDGEDFIREGYEPGPAFGKALDAIRRAKLDGKVVSREEEMTLARSILDGAGSEG
jgi:tRNA nucleotidyltransferase (CCA-adding enzyme)